MLESMIQKIEIALLQAENKCLTETNVQLQKELSSLQSKYDRYRSGELLRRDDFLQTALKILIQSGAITDNR